jgi:hypothetical protein
VGHVADGGQQGGVDHGGADPEQDGAGRPGSEAAGQGGAGQREGLEQPPCGDEGLAAQPVRERAGGELAEAPHGRVQRGQEADLADGEAATDKQQRQQPPGEPVVEVVDQAGLAAGGQGRLPPAGGDHDLAGGQLVGAGGGWRLAGHGVLARGLLGIGRLGFEAGVAAGLADHQRRQPEAEPGVGQAEVERLWSQPGLGSNEAGEVGGEGDGQVAGGLVQAHGQPAGGEGRPGRSS